MYVRINKLREINAGLRKRSLNIFNQSIVIEWSFNYDLVARGFKF